MKKIVSLLSGMVLAGAAMAAQAEMKAPDALIKDTVRDVLDVVRQDKDIRAGDQKKVTELVDEKVLPHFDFTRMTQLAVGKYWRKATPEQKQALVMQFRNMLVRTYTGAFTAYRDQTVDVKPAKVPDGATEVTVKTTINKPGAQPIPVDYTMEKANDDWKVFDLAVNGVSLVTTYRSSFGEQIEQSGIDGLIKALTDKNAAQGKAAPARKAEGK